MYRKHSGQQPAYSMHMYLEDISIRDGRIQQNGSIGSHTKVSSCHNGMVGTSTCDGFLCFASGVVTIKDFELFDSMPSTLLTLS